MRYITYMWHKWFGLYRQKRKSRNRGVPFVLNSTVSTAVARYDGFRGANKCLKFYVHLLVFPGEFRRIIISTIQANYRPMFSFLAAYAVLKILYALYDANFSVSKPR